MRRPARTDEKLSHAAREFEWREAGDNPSHRYLAASAIELLRAHGAMNVLDLGCGNGSFTGRLAAEGFLVEGCDASESGIQIASLSFPEVPFFRHDLSDPLPEHRRSQYDAVVSLEVIEHLLLPRTLLSNACDALRPGGMLVLSTPFHGYLKNLALAITNKFDDHWHPLRDFGHVKFFSKRTLTELLSEYGLEPKSWRMAGRVPWLACSMLVAACKK